MAEPTPSTNPAAAPSATITPTHFPHRTTTAAPTNAMIDTAVPALNSEPVELDSTPVTSTSPTATHASGSAEGGVKGAIKDAISSAKTKLGSSSSSTTHTKTEGVGSDSRLKADDAATMHGPPGTPGAVEFEVGEKKLQ